LHAGRWLSVLFDIDSGIRPELFSQTQPVVQSIQHDHLMGAHILGHRSGVQPQAPSPHNDDRIAFTRTSPEQAGRDRAHGTIDGAEQLIGEFVGDTEERMARWEIEIVGVGAREVRVHAGRGIGPIYTPVGIAPQAEMAVVAWEDR
jgi:hypothetical protein